MKVKTLVHLNKTILIFFVFLTFSALAEEEKIDLIKNKWSFEGMLGTFDRSSLQRGYQVYQEVCSSCHSIQHLSYRNLSEKGGPEFSEEEVKLIASQFEVEDGDQIMMETLYWWGIPTLFRCKNDPDPKNCDIALVGVPHSTGNGTTERDQHLGPRAVRNISAMLRRSHLEYGIDPWKQNKIHDLGDVPFPEANDNEKCIERISSFYDHIEKTQKPVVSIGGDHSITGGILQSLAKKNSKLTKGQKVSIVHFDAHTDCYEKLDHFLGAKKSAAHWASYLVRQGNVDPKTSTQIGIRGNPRTLDWLQASYDIGYQVITMDEYKEFGHEKSSKMILDRLDDKPIYVTFDLDCLDVTVAPGTANLEPAFRGFNIDEARKLIQSLKGKNVIGGDVACLMPTKDSPNNITSMVAASIMFEIICLISFNLNNK